MQDDLKPSKGIIVLNKREQMRDKTHERKITSVKNISQKLMVICLCGILAGCGLAQAVKEGTVSMKDAILYKKITTLRLDFTPRSGLNADEDQTPLATMVWVYQLKDKKTVEGAMYQALLTQSDEILKKTPSMPLRSW